MSHLPKTFPIGIDNNPLINSVWQERFEGSQFPTGTFDFITTEDDDNITSENGDFLITED